MMPSHWPAGRCSTQRLAAPTGPSRRWTAIIAPGGYFLVQQAQGGDTPLPAPDVIGSQAMAADKEQVALVRNQEAITGKDDADVADFVGYGSADEYECGRRTQIVQHHRGPAARRRLPGTYRRQRQPIFK
ncbi:MAG: hypothetical protein R3A10_04375 [Caldilineaceae bacterium]